MPLSFPQFEHVPLKKPPLQEVICQVRFPLILRIGQGAPAEFQDAIRERFPEFETEQALLIEAVPGEPLRPAGVKPPTHRFRNSDGSRMVSLGVDFYALSTTRYESWQSFANDLNFITEAILSVYRVPYATRIGLRYINTLNTENTGYEAFDPEVLDMLRPELTNLLRSEVFQELDYGLADLRTKHGDGSFTFRSGIVRDRDSGQPSFLLDFDRYTEQQVSLSPVSLIERCDEYHALIYNAFRWCLLENELEVFNPA